MSASQLKLLDQTPQSITQALLNTPTPVAKTPLELQMLPLAQHTVIVDQPLMYAALLDQLKS
jgi:hypothetical protein